MSLLLLPLLLLSPWCDEPANAVRSLSSDLARLERLKVVSKEKTDVRELSGIAALKDGTLLMVDDERGIFRITPGEEGKFVKIEHDARLEGPEGIAVSADNKTLYVVSENTREVHTLKLHRDGRIGAPHKIGKLPDLGNTSNKGWEGIAWLPASQNPEGKDRLIAVHEGDPRRVGLFDPDDLGHPVLLELPKKLKDDMKDLSDIAVDPKTGHLFLLSDESHAVAELELREKDGELDLRTLEVIDLPFDKDAKAEGLTFDRKGNLWVASEHDHMIRKIKIER